MEKGFRLLIVEKDSKLAIELIDKSTDVVHHLATILGAICRQIVQGWMVRLVHTYREGNRAADWLLKHNLIYPFGYVELPDPLSCYNISFEKICRGQPPETHCAGH
ncbi:unnamed protein product [Linum trigynum]|uniref:RNase H type-1 domain-containing protein n=1 Tax=Linum trigynum TaxID=586398 RepID=A0AAV2DZE6_9ROSI